MPLKNVKLLSSVLIVLYDSGEILNYNAHCTV